MAAEYTTAQREADESLRRSVQSALYDSLELQKHSLAIVVCEGVVELQGQVPTADLREYAEEQAMAAPGVKRVVNRIQIGRSERD